MKKIIYYFSATGNSMTTADMLAEGLGECEVLPVAALKDEERVKVSAETVGFVFPIYYSDMPHLMRRVISRMEFEGEPYIFSVCTCRGHFGNIAERMDALLSSRGQKLSLSLSIVMPGNSRLSTPEENAERIAAQRGNVNALLKELAQSPVNSYAAEIPPEPSPVHEASNMRGMAVEEHCVGCGICEQVCPMNNIRLENGRAVIGDECLTCLACFHWCPQEAIWMSDTPEVDIVRRFKYHHPEVTLEDIIGQKKL